MTDRKLCVLYVDDDPDLRTIVKICLEMEERLHVSAAATAEEARRIVREERVDLLLLDVAMPDMSGPDLADLLRADGCEAPLIFLTAGIREAELRHLKARGARAVLEKPFDPLTLAVTVSGILDGER